MKATSREKYVQLVQRLVEQRKSAGINQQELGAKLGLDQSSISRYERRELQLDIELLARWCDEVGVTLEALLQAAGYLDVAAAQSTRTARPVLGNNETAYPVGANQTPGSVTLRN